MATDMNAMRDEAGKCLRHFKEAPTSNSAGVKVFAQDISHEDNPYVFPPIPFDFCINLFAQGATSEEMYFDCTCVPGEAHLVTSLYLSLLCLGVFA